VRRREELRRANQLHAGLDRGPHRFDVGAQFVGLGHMRACRRLFGRRGVLVFVGRCRKQRESGLVGQLDQQAGASFVLEQRRFEAESNALGLPCRVEAGARRRPC
jgi:hypothetical protein